MGFKKLLEKILLFEYNLVIREYTRILNTNITNFLSRECIRIWVRIFTNDCLANIYEYTHEFHEYSRKFVGHS